MKWVLHNWDDDQALQILGNCRRAARPDARLLVIERVLPETDEPFDGKLLDLNMLVLQGGRERTEAEYTSLLSDAGFRRVRRIETGSPVSIIEAVPA